MENIRLGCPTKESDYHMAGLKAAAEAGDEDAFLVALKNVDWQNWSAEDYIHASRLALQAGAHLAARRLSTQFYI
jgi:hypothetical protein